MSKIRDRCFHYWKIEHQGGFWLPCHCRTCQGVLFNPAATRWQAAHIVRRSEGGSDEPPNVVPMIEKCHKYETDNIDIPDIAKGKRRAKRHYGLKPSGRSYRKPNPPDGMRYDSFKRRFVPLKE